MGFRLPSRRGWTCWVLAGSIPNRMIGSDVISAPPLTPVMPARRPMLNPETEVVTPPPPFRNYARRDCGRYWCSSLETFCCDPRRGNYVRSIPDNVAGPQFLENVFGKNFRSLADRSYIYFGIVGCFIR